MENSHETQRRKLWCDAFISITEVLPQLNRPVTTEQAVEWADDALKEFDKKFRP